MSVDVGVIVGVLVGLPVGVCVGVLVGVGVNVTHVGLHIPSQATATSPTGHVAKLLEEQVELLVVQKTPHSVAQPPLLLGSKTHSEFTPSVHAILQHPAIPTAASDLRGIVRVKKALANRIKPKASGNLVNVQLSILIALLARSHSANTARR